MNSLLQYTVRPIIVVNSSRQNHSYNKNHFQASEVITTARTPSLKEEDRVPT